MKIHDKLIAKEEKIAVVGLGYVGLPIALEFAKITNVIGFDINPERVSMMKNKIWYYCENKRNIPWPSLLKA